MIGLLLYIMLGTHPDIAFVVIKLSQFAADPSKDHLIRSLYICCYLGGTPNYSLVYTNKINGGLCTYVDSDWATDSLDHRSMACSIVQLSGGLVSCITRVQETTALSSTEVEYMSLSDACRQLVWINTLLNELHIDLSPLPLCGDNKGAIFMAQNPVTEKRSKHIDVCYHFHQVLASGQVELYFVDGQANPVDMFTKNLGHAKYLNFRGQLGLEFYDSPYDA